MSSNSSYRLPSGGGSRGRDRRGSGDGRIPEVQPVEINRYNLLVFMNRNNFMHSIQKNVSLQHSPRSVPQREKLSSEA